MFFLDESFVFMACHYLFFGLGIRAESIKKEDVNEKGLAGKWRMATVVIVTFYFVLKNEKKKKNEPY